MTSIIVATIFVGERHVRDRRDVVIVDLDHETHRLAYRRAR
jgi:hypothetical protein